MFITTLFYSAVTVFNFRRRALVALAFLLFFGLVDGAFLSANLLKVPEGGWFSVLLAGIFTIVLSVWRSGRLRMVKAQARMTLPDAELFGSLAPARARGAALLAHRNPAAVYPGLAPVGASVPRRGGGGGTVADVLGEAAVPVLPHKLVICYSSTASAIPAAFAHFLERMPVRPEFLVLVTAVAVNVPFVVDGVSVEPLAQFENVYRAIVSYGYFEPTPNAVVVTAAVARAVGLQPYAAVGGVSGGEAKPFFGLLPDAAAPLEDDERESDALVRSLNPTFVVGRDSVEPAPGSGALHRAFVFCFSVLLATSRSAASMLGVPNDLLLEVGLRVPV